MVRMRVIARVRVRVRQDRKEGYVRGIIGTVRSMPLRSTVRFAFNVTLSSCNCIRDNVAVVWWRGRGHMLLSL